MDLAMKRILLTFIASLIVATAAGQRFDGAIFVGMNLSQIDGDNSGHYTHFGMHGAVQTSFALGKDIASPWRMIVELGVTEKGANKASTNIKTNLLYVEMPVMASYSFLDGKLRLAAGVAPAILAKARVKDSKMDDPEAAKAYRRMDWLPLCAEVSYFFGGHWGVNFRFNASMVSIMDNPSKGTYRIFRANKGAFNNYISFNVGFRF
jgi:hypothetical protein